MQKSRFDRFAESISNFTSRGLFKDDVDDLKNAVGVEQVGDTR